MPTDHKRFDRIFNPKTVVVVGAKKATNYSWLRNMLTVKGKLYSVQLDENEIPGIEDLGVTNYKSMAEIPEPIDYVLVAVPRNVAPIILADAIKANVGGVAMFTSGFAETDDDGRALQEKIRGMALEAGMPLIGPNCMGIFNPAAGVRQNEDQYHGESGPVGFIGQSGTHTVYTSTTLNVVHGVKLAKAVSFGNAAVPGSGGLSRLLRRRPQDRDHRDVHRGGEGRAAFRPRAAGGGGEEAGAYLEGRSDGAGCARRRLAHRLAGGPPGHLGHDDQAGGGHPRR